MTINAQQQRLGEWVGGELAIHASKPLTAAQVALVSPEPFLPALRAAHIRCAAALPWSAILARCRLVRLRGRG